MAEELRPWTNGFISQAASARENDALTRALRMSFFSGLSSSSVAVPSPDLLSFGTSSPFLLLPDPPLARIGKKRKTRPCKRSPTTYIAADPANFRQLVHQVTGVGAGGGAEGNRDEDPPLPDVQGSYFLPTLDTSACLLNRIEQGPEIGPVDHAWVFPDVDAVVL
ncbi:calmodulin-binding protein 25-like [Zingiber officinale]|uniref:calmodulin-binding protein 25-like n=1 Tax=Zingiber officinale TaxID=94328 RepID=UPI001C4CAE62|nr:calmodulin-binding protein 25-like [Zingiber officinale]